VVKYRKMKRKKEEEEEEEEGEEGRGRGSKNLSRSLFFSICPCKERIFAQPKNALQ
jgi:hypothetical protein